MTVKNILMRKCQLAVIENSKRLFLTKLGQLFPPLLDYLPALMHIQMLLSNWIQLIIPSDFLPQIEEVPALWILNQVQTIIDQRKQVNNDIEWKPTDLLQVVIDHLHSFSPSNQLHEKEICANILMFLITAFDSVSTVLASCTYILATHPDIQKKLRSEIEEQQWTDDCSLDDHTVNGITYLGDLIREVLRMYSIALTATRRECHWTTSVCGHLIEKDFSVQFFPSLLSLSIDPVLSRIYHSTGYLESSLRCPTVGTRRSE